jgi:hypothetical protein
MFTHSCALEQSHTHTKATLHLISVVLLALLLSALPPLYSLQRTGDTNRFLKASSEEKGGETQATKSQRNAEKKPITAEKSVTRPLKTAGKSGAQEVEEEVRDKDLLKMVERPWQRFEEGESSSVQRRPNKDTQTHNTQRRNTDTQGQKSEKIFHESKDADITTEARRQHDARAEAGSAGHVGGQGSKKREGAGAERAGAIDVGGRVLGLMLETHERQ